MNILNIITGNCIGIIGEETYEILQYIYTAIRISVPVLVVLLVTVDMGKAVVSQDENGIKKAKSDSVKRIIIGVAIFFVPTILDLLFGITNLALGTCGLGG